MKKPSSDTFFAVLGQELVEWGVEVRNRLLAFYDAPPAEVKEAAQPPPLKPTGAEKHFDPETGALQRCVVCRAEKTVDGRYCLWHWSP